MKRCICLTFFAIAIASLAFSQRLTKEQLLQDLMYYRDTLPVKHKNLFSKITRKEFERKVNLIASKLDTLNKETFIAELFRLNVAIGDEHTRVEPAYKMYLPVQFELFEDGIFVTGIAPDKSAFLLHKLVEINGHSMAEVNRKFREVIKNDNRSYFETNMLHFLNNPSFLKGLGLLDSDTVAALTLQDVGKNNHKVRLMPVAQRELKLVMADQHNRMPAYKGAGRNYWYEYDTVKKVIYFNFASCSDDEKNPFPVFNEELFSKIRSARPGKIIVDLRFNSGGNSGVLQPFIDSITSSYLNRKGHLFVLIGKRTFSSSLMNAIALKRYTNAILVGQMTSGNINHYGETRGFFLPNTGILIGYSTRYWENWKGKKGALLPDKEIFYYSDSFIHNKDEALEYVYKQ